MAAELGLTTETISEAVRIATIGDIGANLAKFDVGERQVPIRVQLKTDSRNRQSQTAIERIGAKKEGVLRKHMIMWDKHERNTVMYSIIDKEWPEIKAQLRLKLL